MLDRILELESNWVLKFFATYAAPQYAAPMRKTMLHAAPQLVTTVCKALLDLESKLKSKMLGAWQLDCILINRILLNCLV